MAWPYWKTADNADEEEEDEVLTNPGLETPNKFGPGLVGCYASQATSASAGGRVRTKQERQEQQASDTCGRSGTRVRSSGRSAAARGAERVVAAAAAAAAGSGWTLRRNRGSRTNSCRPKIPEQEGGVLYK